MEHPSRGSASLPFAVLNFALLPFTAFVYTVLIVYHSLRGRKTDGKKLGRGKKVLLTGANSPNAIALARILRAEGHTVLGADYEWIPYLSPARFSRGYTKFYALPRSKPTSATNPQTVNGASPQSRYTTTLESIISNAGKLDIWIPFDASSSSTHFEAWKLFKRVYSVRTIWNPRLALWNSPTDFYAFVEEYLGQKAGIIRIPEATRVETRAQIHGLLHRASKEREYTLYKENNSGLNGIHQNGALVPRTHIPVAAASQKEIEITTLPKSTVNQTWDAVANIHIKKGETWYLREKQSGQRYTASALIVKGKVKTFVLAQHNSSIKHESRPVEPTSVLHKVILSFIADLATSYTTHNRNTEFADLNTHLTLNFIVSETSTDTGISKSITATSISTHPDLSSLFLTSNHSNTTALAEAYTSTASSSSWSPESIVTDVGSFKSLYSFPYAVNLHLIIPILNLLRWRSSLGEVIKGISSLLNTLLTSKEEVFEWSDPGPAWILYSVYPILGEASERWRRFLSISNAAWTMLLHPTLLVDEILNAVGRMRLRFIKRKEKTGVNGRVAHKKIA